jgi:hypothetical protein
VQNQLELLRAANQALVDNRRAQGLRHTSEWNCVDWDASHQMWRVRVTYDGVQHHLGLFHVEDDACLHADKVLRRIGAEERCNRLLDGTRTGYGRRGDRPQAQQIAGLIARVDANRKSPWHGATPKGNLWRSRVTMASCMPDTPCRVAQRRGVRCTCKDCMPDTPCRVAQRRGVRCTCKQVQKWLTHPDTGGFFKTDEEAAWRYNQAVLDNNLHEPPYSKDLNPPPGLDWSSPCPAWAKPNSALTLGP